jgi:hypothetical protein
MKFFDPTRIARRMPHPRARPLTSPRILHVTKPVR